MTLRLLENIFKLLGLLMVEYSLLWSLALPIVTTYECISLNLVFFFHQIEKFLKRLLSNGIAQDDIGVITPYHAQVLALKKILTRMKKVRVGTVEEFQGEEKMVIVYSAVKTSGLDKALQFIFCPKRLNTAISRAR